MRVKSPKHLDWIRSLPCTVCENPHETEAAHVRMSEASVGKPITGIGIKPDDSWVTPLCGVCHRQQHEEDERRFWFRYGINPIRLALALWQASGDYERGLIILKHARTL